MQRIHSLIAVCFLLGIFCSIGYAQSKNFGIGRIPDITVDGKTDDWNMDDDQKSGLQINIFNSNGKSIPSTTDFRPTCRFAWNEQGIYLLAIVKDDVFTESANTSDIWRNDAIEFFMADAVGGKQRLQLLIAPGMDLKHPQPRYHLNNQSANKPDGVEKYQPVIARTKQEHGYTLEAMIPWDILQIDTRKNQTIGLQIFFNDVDGESHRDQLFWYPSGRTYADSSMMQSVFLRSSPSAPVNASAKATIEYLSWLKIDVTAVAELAGKRCSFATSNHSSTSKVLKPKGDFSHATFRVPIDLNKSRPQWMNVNVEGSSDCPIDVPNLDDQRRDMLLKTELRFEPSTIFQTSELPQCKFTQPLVMEKLLGPYTIQTDYYDANCNAATSAEKPGRYAAVIKIHCHDTNKTITRYRALYRMPVNVEPWDMKFEGDIKLPTQYGIDPAVVKASQLKINNAVNWSFWDIAQNASFNASLLSSLSQIKPDTDITVYNGVNTIEKQYWTTLERKINGNDKMFTRNFALPAKLDKPVTSLHAGTMTEAGMTEDAPQKIDAILTEWAKDTDEAFIACVVRNGVIVHHKAYGTRDEKPMTTDTNSWMASLSKLISGTMAMMMVDQQLINLDTPIDRYLPEMQNAGFNQVPTIRNLWTHTAGLTSHRGEDDPDLEHLIASIAPQLNVGKKFEYDGMGMELGIQLMGQVSGKCYPTMVKTHLLDPLGCKNTNCENASWNTASTAMDMAKIGQMLLNGGSYGEYRFMSQQTRDAMLPIDISTITTDKSPTKYGIGTQWYTGDGLSDMCFAHGAASSATLRIDLKHNLVISMTRNNAGKNFGKYHSKFIKTITDCIKDN
tara:strand:+ start:2714 stop:5242 length:2529 start_codon:yes stop_codon:yes gene_type:complete